MKIFLRSYLLAGWSYLIFRLLTLPFYGQPGASPWQADKLIHFFLFGIFSVLACAVFLSWKNNRRQAILYGFGLALIYSAGLEIYQNYVPGRSPVFADLLAGMAGAALFIPLIMLLDRRPRLLLHACCAVCAARLAGELKKDYDLAIYFYNPNIYPEAEYRRRLDEVRRLAKICGLPLYEGGAEYGKWRSAIAGHEHDPERGERCRRCYFLRLKSAARIARERKFGYFTTTLTVSPHKDAAAVLAIGRALAARYGIGFLDRDFKKQDGFKKAIARAKELNLYRQDYCGCEYSIKRRP